MKAYRSLFKLYKEQPIESVFAHFYAINGDWDEPFRIVAAHTSDGIGAWGSSSNVSALSIPILNSRSSEII